MPEIVITEKTLTKPSQPNTNPANLQLPPIAWRGLFKDYRELVGGTTEAADEYHYACFLQVLGPALGRRLHVYHARKLYPNFYIVLVGKTAIARKDTAEDRGRQPLQDLHQEEDVESPKFQIIPGIGSAEGLLDALAGERKVVLLNESEFLSLLLKARQEGVANLIPKLASLFDCPDLETLKTRQRAVKCREPFLSILCGTTSAWLSRALTEKEIYGGFANRFIFVGGEPKSPIPFPPKMDSGLYSALLKHINDMRVWAEGFYQSTGGELSVADGTKALFADYYRGYHERCASDSLLASLIPRVQTAIWKIALLYAATDRSETILPEHLETAVAVGNYLEASIGEVFRSFGDSRGKRSETRVLDYLKRAEQPVPYRDVHRNLNFSSAQLQAVVEPLIKLGLIRNQYRDKERLLEAI